MKKLSLLTLLAGMLLSSFALACDANKEPTIDMWALNPKQSQPAPRSQPAVQTASAGVNDANKGQR